MKFMYTPQGRGFIISCLFLLFSFNTLAQVGIGNTNPNNDALLEIGDATTTTKGLLLPRVNLVNTSNFAPMTAHVQGMVVYNKNTAGDVTPGYYYNDGSQWVRIAASSVPSNDWTTTGNTGTTGGTGVGQNYLGTTDGEALIIATQATQRMRLLANGQIVINDTGAPIAGDRLTVQGANDEYAINGYSSGGTGVGVYGENTSNSVNAFGVYGLSSGAGNGVRGTNNNTGIGVIGFSSLSGVGTQGQNSGSGYGMAAFNTGTGGGIYLQSNFNNIYSNLTATGGVGEYIDLDNQNGIGVNVVGVINPANPSVGTAGDVWAFTSALKTQTPTSTSVNGGILLGNQYGVGHGMLLSHRGTAGRNAEINSLTATNTDPNIVAIGLNRGSTMVVQNQNNNLPAAVSPLIVGDFGYFGTDLDDHIGISGYSDPSAGTADWGIGVQGAGGYVGVLGIDQTGGLGYGVYSLGDSGASGAKFFAIDDPRDPANKILRHASIESNEILNLYRGTETFSSNGKVVVTLPDYYDAINRNASYQLTPIGAAMPNLYIEKEIQNGTFIIAGGEPGKKVSWTVTSERNDPYLQQNPEKREMVVDKGAKRGKFLMPELYGQPKEKAYSYFNTDKLKVNDVSLTSKMDMSQNDVVEPNPANSTIKNKEVSPTTSSEENKQQQSQTEINTGAENTMTPANSLNTEDNN